MADMQEGSKRVADIHKLFCDAVIKLKPGMSAQAAALSMKTEFDTDHNGVIDRAEFGVMISKVLELRLSSDVEELLWSSCCKHETFAKWVVGNGTAEGRFAYDGDDEDIDRAEFECVISRVLALRLPGYVEELLWMDFCGHKSFASWVGDETETAEEPDSQRLWAQPRTVNCWGGDRDAGSAVQNGMKASASVRRPRPRPRSRPQPGSELSPTTSRFVSTTTVGLAAAAAQSTDLVQNSTGHLPAKVRALPKRAAPATAPMCTRRLNLDAADPNSERLHGASKGHRGASRGPPSSWDG